MTKTQIINNILEVTQNLKHGEDAREFARLYLLALSEVQDLNISEIYKEISGIDIRFGGGDKNV